MRHNNTMSVMLAITAVAVLGLAGCATTSSSTSLRFSSSEVKLIPKPSMRRVLLPAAENETVKVRAKGVPGDWDVQGMQGREHVVVTKVSGGQERELPVNEITEIERIRRFKRSTFGNSSATDAIGETLIYAPLIPVALVSWPFLHAMGLDASQNASDDAKALLAYKGMTRAELIANLGEPADRYRCVSKEDKDDADEVWVYPKDKVLRGGRSLFIDLKTGKVSFTSFLFPTWDDCTRLAE